MLERMNEIMVKKYRLEKMNQQVDQIFDLFICCCSFEDRCLSFLKNIDIGKIKRGVVFYNRECLDYMKENKTELASLLGKKGRFVELLHMNPLYTADQISVCLNELARDKEIKTILLDITTFTHECLLVVIRLLQIKFKEAAIVCAYSNAKEYNPNCEVDEKWLSKGIIELRSVLGYAGSILPAQKTHLILIVGYEHERAISIINELEPNSISLGFGKSDNATTQKNQDANEHYVDLVERMATNYIDLDCFEIKCDNPYETKEKIIEKSRNLEGENIIIIPLNNKISTIGVAMAALENDNLQVCYAPAKVYNYYDYSEAGDMCYMFELCFPED